MNLKQSFNVQNVLNEWFRQAKNILSSSSMVSTKIYHQKSLACDGAKDEIVAEEKDQYNLAFNDNEIVSNNDILRFAMEIINLKSDLSRAIADVKRSLPYDIDSEISLNILRRNLSDVCNAAARIKSSETFSKDRGYKFNSDDVQVEYVYPTKKVVTIDFDRNLFAKQRVTLSKIANDLSNQIETAMIVNEVEFDDKGYDFTGSFDDAIAHFLSK